MKKDSYLFTSESVTEGHPDKLADRISDAILDAILKEDRGARVACEVFLTTGLVIVGGEITTKAHVDVRKLVRDTITEVGYTDASYGIDGKTCAVLIALDEQSPDIAQGVNAALEVREDAAPKQELGAGDQGMMFGYATSENDEMMPTPILYAHKLAKQLAQVRKDGTLPYLRPDGKTQVTVEYIKDQPARIDKVVVSCQHAEEVDQKTIRKDVIELVVRPVIPSHLLDEKTEILVNPTGRFVIGGPHGDAGLTGRKIIVDTYGGFARHGGGAFSGKDPTKVDRSAAYAARWVAKNLVAAGLARKCEVQVSYAIGVAKPLSLNVYSYGSGSYPDDFLAQVVEQVFDLRPSAIIQHFDLLRPIYKPFSAYGHFGRLDVEAPWEKLDRVEAIKEVAKTLAQTFR